MGTPSGFISAMKMTCPNCRKGRLFETTTLSFSKPFTMPTNCPECNQRYMPEPGFYFGAMFISYIFWGFMSLFIVGGGVIFLGYSVTKSLLILGLISAILFVWLFRVSRSIWIHLMVSYQSKKKV